MINTFFSAIKYFTRLPIPNSWCNYSPQVMSRVLLFLPFIGVLVGLTTYFAFFLSIQLFNQNIASVLAIMATVFFTGAFHHDGLADVADGFGGGWSKDQVLRIMKDSSSGVYAVVAICIAMLLQYSILSTFRLDKILLAVVSSAIISRIFPVVTAFFGVYARTDNSSRAADIAKKISLGELLMSLLPVVGLLFINWQLLYAIVVCFIAWLFLFLYFKKRIGGYTGDCLGAIQQITEIVSLLTLFALWQ